MSDIFKGTDKIAMAKRGRQAAGSPSTRAREGWARWTR